MRLPDRKLVGLLVAGFILVAAVIMAFDLARMQAASPLRSEMVQLQVWKISTLFVGGMLAGAVLYWFYKDLAD